ASFDLWITPPEYTGLAPQFLRAGDRGPVAVPTGSVLLAQVHGGGRVPQLAIDAEGRDLQPVDKQNFRIEATLSGGRMLSLTQGGATLGQWPIEIVPDNPPAIAFAQPPKGTARAALRLDYRASDDYGVESVKAVIHRTRDKPGDPPSEEAVERELPPPGLDLKDAQATRYHDLCPAPAATGQRQDHHRRRPADPLGNRAAHRGWPDGAGRAGSAPLAAAIAGCAREERARCRDRAADERAAPGARPLPAVARRGDAAQSGCGAATGRSVEGHHRPRPPAHARPRPRDGAQRRARPGARIAVANAEHAGKPARRPARADAARRQRSAADDARLAAIDAAPAAAPRQELPGAAAAGPTRTTGTARPTGTARAAGP